MRLIINVVGTGVAIALAVLSSANALSSASIRSSPELSVAVWPANGLSLERVAYRLFVENVRGTLNGAEASKERSEANPDVAKQIRLSGLQLQQSAANYEATAKSALRYEPLLPQAHAILILSERDPRRKGRIIALASQLNRRELSLQGLVLQNRIDVGDYPGAINTLDQILRVHPERKAEFFPVLTDALKQSGTNEAFREMLTKPLPWRESFLLYAVRDPKAAANLAVIRKKVSFGSSEFDRSLVANLARNGDIEAAAEIYRLLAKDGSRDSGGQWMSAYPPFDWTFADKTGLRAQLGRDNRYLGFAIDPGNGGTLASRLIALPTSPLTITIYHVLEQGSSAKDLKLTLACYGQKAPFFEASFGENNGRFDVGRAPACKYALLAITGRAWTGSTPLNGTISDVQISPR